MLLCQGGPTKTSLGLLPTPEPFTQTGPMCAAGRRGCWADACISLHPGKEHEFGRDLVCWQDTALRNLGDAQVCNVASWGKGSRKRKAMQSNVRKEIKRHASGTYGQEFIFQRRQNCVSVESPGSSSAV